jgi:hypothetical protein
MEGATYSSGGQNRASTAEYMKMMVMVMMNKNPEFSSHLNIRSDLSSWQ